MKTESRKKTASKKSKPAARAPKKASVAAPVEQPKVIPQSATAQKGRMRTGQVVSVKMEKTIAVKVEQRVAHPLYRKIVRRHKKLYAHDEGSVAKPGDWVRIQESRPLSRLKCWRLVEIVRPARQEEAV
ncbi:30S ribosomal protein S17 [Methylacidimicrobium tartarophylax]|uniref:Small ribosomal subunit protein uS17 n=1 Tax=Methylacidimicrobium tartarophylax TaxID=1041768 RepID=A0A5E6MCQ1_9BACT|nr:30S ribosomal protein S17 [Methylacidimicrobium tartarophylax]VVM06710.1 30S ribosomal protein S17 [Methylacidimicrobium tartarophylax]